ncbi:ion channel [Paenibacillus sp. oral taxon 786]|uniref:ion channel n=1 Tax=Paenibacillus sp. oral taxon 786 TaxID=652715 RepID=UPI00056AD8A8|nr:ion channel [Paenibacillus sp. oral taxon 786]
MGFFQTILALLLLMLVIFIFNKLERFLSARALIFTPILLPLLIYFANLVSFGSVIDIFAGNINQTIFCVLIFSFIITGFYILYIFERIAQSSIDDNVTKALFRIGYAAASSCIYFALIYTIVYRVSGNTAFQGNVGEGMLSQLISFLYFSTIIFTVGFSDISPVGSLPRLLVLLEVVLGFITVIYAISSFAYFKDKFKTKSPFLITNKSRQIKNKEE